MEVNNKTAFALLYAKENTYIFYKYIIDILHFI